MLDGPDGPQIPRPNTPREAAGGTAARGEPSGVAQDAPAGEMTPERTRTPMGILRAALGEAAAELDVEHGAIVAAHELLSTASLVEPLVTADITTVAARSRGTLADIETRIKDRPSLEKKIRDDCLVRNQTVAEAAANVADVLRYTVVFSESDFVAGVTDSLRVLEERGVHVDPTEVRNFFIVHNRYKGLHAIVGVRDPRGGPDLRCEIQFHTPKSLEVKHATHDLYRVVRDPEADVHRRRAAYDSIVAASDVIPHPPGVVGIGRLKPTQRP